MIEVIGVAIQEHKVKNVSISEMGEKLGRIHMVPQVSAYNNFFVSNVVFFTPFMIMMHVFRT